MQAKKNRWVLSRRQLGPFLFCLHCKYKTYSFQNYSDEHDEVHEYYAGQKA